MQLSYFDLISPKGFAYHPGCHIRSPRLKDIAGIGSQTYQFYLNLFSLTEKSYFEMAGAPDFYESMEPEEQERLHLYDLLMTNRNLCSVLIDALNFFVEEEIKYDTERRTLFLTSIIEEDGIKQELPIYVEKESYRELCNLILQRNFIKNTDIQAESRTENKKAEEIMKKLKKGREEKSKTKDAAPDLELGNIISAVASKHNSLNIVTIWDMTVYQLWDCFYRLCNNQVLDIQTMSVAAWGDKDHHYDASAWFKRIHNESD